MTDDRLHRFAVPQAADSGIDFPSWQSAGKMPGMRQCGQQQILGRDKSGWAGAARVRLR